MVQKVITTHSWYIRHPKVIILKIHCLGLIPNCCNWFLSALGATQQTCAQAECKVNFRHWLLIFKHELCFLQMLCLKFILLWPFPELSAESQYKESKARSDKIYLKHPEWILLQYSAALLSPALSWSICWSPASHVFFWCFIPNKDVISAVTSYNNLIGNASFSLKFGDDRDAPLLTISRSRDILSVAELNFFSFNASSCLCFGTRSTAMPSPSATKEDCKLLV